MRKTTDLLSDLLQSMKSASDAVEKLIVALDQPEIRPEYITKSDAARYLGVSPSYISKRIKDGTLTPYTTGLKFTDLLDFEERGRVSAGRRGEYRV